MRRKKIYFIAMALVIFQLPGVFLLHGEYPVSSIVLLDRREDPTLPIPLPDRFLLEILVAADTLYKLSYGENIISTGRFTTGINTVSIQAGQIFIQNGSRKYDYVLEMKTGEKISQIRITLDVEIKSETPSAQGINTGQSITKAIRHDEVSIMIGGRVIDSYLKTSNMMYLLTGKGKPEAAPVEFDPVHLSQTKKYSASVNPIMMAFMAYKTISGKIKKKKEEKIREKFKAQRERTNEINGVFWKLFPDGKKVPVELSIKLSVN